MCRITLDFRRSTILYRDQNAARVRTIVRTGGMHHFFHRL
jgi:hypothetical protein